MKRVYGRKGRDMRNKTLKSQEKDVVVIKNVSEKSYGQPPKIVNSSTMYGSSRHYKDACESGKVEYASAYRTLLWMIKSKQNNINWGEKLINAGYKNVVLVGAGDLCDIFMREMQQSDIQVCGIIENDFSRYWGKYAKGLLMKIEEVEEDFCKEKKFIINYMNRYDDWVVKLQNRGVKIDNIVSIEEIISYILLA